MEQQESTTDSISDGSSDGSSDQDHRPPAPYEEFARMLVGGAWRSGRSGEVAEDRDPYTGEVVIEVSLADASDIDEAYQTAQLALRPWGATRPQERRALFLRAARIVEQRKGEIVDWLIRESGSTRAKAAFEWRLVYLEMLEAASIPFHLDGKILPASLTGKENRVYRRPAGVVGVISPWSFPLHLSVRTVAPALAVGDTVVLKPASDTPVTGGLLLARIFEEAGLPPEVLNVVPAHGRALGDAFVAHPIPRVISFTGSTASGRRVAEQAGRNIKRVCLELGGNCPFIVLEDADLERAVRAGIAGKFLHQGQSCLAVNRFLIAASRYEEFVDRFVQRVDALKVGDPDDPDTSIGPVINEKQLDSIVRKVDETVARGARVLRRGDPDALSLPPVVLVGVTNDMPAAKEEVFGPVVSILRFQGEDDAIRLANDSDGGLSSAIFTRDGERGVRLARRLEAGMTQVNDWPIADEPDAGFGGEKASGLGRFGGERALDHLTTAHWISLRELPAGYPV